ncbi:uncharacterized protein PADG_03083 [Paracoccidioides brasiliensis Pb18]|uniref:WSC domain-containing protein n=1 Tax=Paracoccidioides brasiliensis (strain Pb18) TaxID=502780 RepID=C1G7C8_PARBD|nr:uncharacterized protein PADG_03083 [Paracoccidioides brasiliensis Pb18]EEH46985.1 hypothetical protein PADG_03083 [Paracoccidioides brasiliensis Pb18]
MLFSSLALSILFARAGFGLQVTEGSPCEEKCLKPARNTTPDDIVCRDFEFNERPGSNFQECVKCELKSPYSRLRTFEQFDTDVKWGLYNLRYAFSSCVFGYPEEKTQALSTPCQVACDSLGPAIKSNLVDPGPSNMHYFCGMKVFDDGIITKCASCFNLTDSEKYLANFIEAIRQGCHANLPNNVPFIIDPDRIFKAKLLPPKFKFPKVEGPAKPKSQVKNLVLIIVFSILGFLLLMVCACAGCIFYICRRRRKAKRRNQPTYLHERWDDTSIMSPVHRQLRRSWGEPSPYQPEFTGPYAEYGNQNYASTNEAPQDIKYPVEAYAMDTHPSTTPQFATVSPKSKLSSPKLSAAPPPRKSTNG